jgi:hypothetical protein
VLTSMPSLMVLMSQQRHCLQLNNLGVPPGLSPGHNSDLQVSS